MNFHAAGGIFNNLILAAAVFGSPAIITSNYTIKFSIK